MTPEKRSAEDEQNNSHKKIKEDELVAEFENEDENDNSSEGAAASESSNKILSVPADQGTLVFCGCLQWDFIGRRKEKINPSLMHFTPRIMKPLSGIKVAYVAAHSSSAHAVIVTGEGKAMTMGRNEKGQLGIGDTEVHQKIKLVEAMKEFVVVQAAVGRNHTLFLTDRGSVFSCGDNRFGQCGVGNTTATIHLPCRISHKESKILKVACGADFSMIIDNRGYLYSFGLPEYGQLGHNTDGQYFLTSNKLSYHFETTPRRVPVFIERAKDGHATPITDVNIIDVSCGNNHTVIVDANKRAFSWGFGGYGRLGHAEQKDEMVPRFIKFFEGPKRGVHKAFCGAQFTIALTELGVFLWGQTKRTGEANMYPKPVQDLCGWDVRDIGCSANSIVVSADRSVISWGPSPTYGELGLGDNFKSTTTPKEVKFLDGSLVHQVTCSLGFTLMIAKDDEEEDKKILEKLKEIDL